MPIVEHEGRKDTRGVFCRDVGVRFDHKCRPVEFHDRKYDIRGFRSPSHREHRHSGEQAGSFVLIRAYEAVFGLRRRDSTRSELSDQKLDALLGLHHVRGNWLDHARATRPMADSDSRLP